MKLLSIGIFLAFGTAFAQPKPLKTFTKDGVSVHAYDFSGLEYFLNKDDGTTYVVNFWATWCVPCIEELPYFEELHENYKDEGVKVILVSLDMSRMVESRLLPFIRKKELKAEVLYLWDPDADSWIPKVDKSWSGAIPATIIYKGAKRAFYERSFTYGELEEELRKIKE